MSPVHRSTSTGAFAVPTDGDPQLDVFDWLVDAVAIAISFLILGRRVQPVDEVE